MRRAIVLREHGGPEALAPEEVSVDAPGQGEILVHQTAVGVNFHDVYVRSGLYRTLALPGLPRIEAVGTIAAVEDVYDAVCRDTFAESVESLAFCGTPVNDGQASGPVDPIAPAALGAKSNSLSRPVVFHYLRRRSALEAMAAELFQAAAAGVLKADIGLHLPLDRAGEAHAALEARRTTGAVVLIP